MSPHRRVFVIIAGVALAAALFVAVAGQGTRTQAHAGSYLYFPGPGTGHIEVPDDPALSPAEITIEAWVFLNNYESYNETTGGIEPVVAGKGWLSSYMLTIWGGRPRFYSGFDSWAAPSVIPVGEWVHVAAAFDGTDVRIYINGGLDTEQALVGGLRMGSAPLWIGSDSNYEGTPHGALDEVRLWSVARTGQDIADTMNTTITEPTAGLICAWNMEGGADADVGPCTGTLVDDAEFRDEPLTPPIEWGNSDCDEGITTRDNQALLRKVLSQGALSQTEPCPDLGELVMVDGVERMWGNWDCDEGITTRDNQALLRKVLSQGALSQTEPCPGVGDEVALG